MTLSDRIAIAAVVRPGPLSLYALDDLCRAIQSLEDEPEKGTPTLSKVERERVEAELEKRREAV